MHDTGNFMPPQAPPIDRTPSGAGAFRSQSGVDASTIFGPPIFGGEGGQSIRWKPGCQGSWSECLENTGYVIM